MDNRPNQRQLVRAQVVEAAGLMFGDDAPNVNVDAVTSHILDTRALNLGETLLLGKLLTYAAEQTLEAKASAGK
jgi:hypothetical protein